MKRLKKRQQIPLAVIILALLVFFFFWLADFLLVQFSSPPTPEYGVTFSTHYSQQLGLNPEEVYNQILTDLKVKRVRLPVYWDSVEVKQGEYNFSSYDQMLDLAGKNGAEVILAVGYKVPRWPECFPPDWTASLDEPTYQQTLLNFIGTTIDRYKNRPEIVAWQVENEPLLDFGKCDILGEEFLKQEVALVKSKDQRPVVLTDSGEWGAWVLAMRHSDIMGTSLYRTVWNPAFGFFRYPLPPFYYSLKAALLQKLVAPHSQGVIVSELQAEPWSPGKPLTRTPFEEQIKTFSLEDFQEVVEFTKKTRITQQYLWGVEWWYYMKLHGYPEYWDYAKELFK